MSVQAAIGNRRSIRRFSDRQVPRELIERLLEAATLAPSGKNRQPWRFAVVSGPAKRQEMVGILRQAISALKAAGINSGSAEWSANSMEQAPYTIFVFDPLWPADTPWDVWSLVDVQSTGAAIQNMLLTAEELGLGTLWLCDVLYAREELAAWLGATDTMIAAVAAGYAAENPPARPRRPWAEITTWVE